MADTAAAEVQKNETSAVPAEIVAKFDEKVEFKDHVFRFKKDKTGIKRPNVELKLPIPTVHGLVYILQNGNTETGRKALDLVMEGMEDTVRSVAAGYIADNEEVNATNFPYEMCDWMKIATMPKEDRRSSNIAPEVWEAFAQDYVQVMAPITSKTPAQLGNAVTVFRKKWSLVKNEKEIIRKLKDQLALYVEHSKQAEDFEAIIKMLNEKADVLLESNTVEQLIKNL